MQKKVTEHTRMYRSDQEGGYFAGLRMRSRRNKYVTLCFFAIFTDKGRNKN